MAKDKTSKKKEEIELREIEHRIKNEDDQTNISKIQSCVDALCGHYSVPNEIPGSPEHYYPILEGKNRDIAVHKLMELIQKL